MSMCDAEIQDVSVKIRSGVESMWKQIRFDIENFALM